MNLWKENEKLICNILLLQLKSLLAGFELIVHFLNLKPAFAGFFYGLKCNLGGKMLSSEKEKTFQEIISKLARTTEDIVSLEEFKKKLGAGRQLKIKFGADVTAPFLHLGHAVNLWMMRELQESGHKVIFLIGDFTTKIGDPTGKSKTRKIIPEEEIEKNANEFINQISKVLITDNPDLFEVRRNSEWFNKMKLADFMDLLADVTHTKLISRDMFRKRIENNQQITIQEMLYPILQGFDSVMLESDLTIVGSDQLFNEMMGRFFQNKHKQEPQIVMTSKITAGLDGKEKQSKSLNNFIALTDSANEMFGKVMSLPDEQIIPWFKVYTNIDLKQIADFQCKLDDGKLNPRDLKLELAAEVTSRYHGEELAARSKENFLSMFSQKDFPLDAPVVFIEKETCSLLELLESCFPKKSRAQLKKLVLAGAVRINRAKFINFNTLIKVDKKLEIKVGKRNFFNIKKK